MSHTLGLCRTLDTAFQWRIDLRQQLGSRGGVTGLTIWKFPHYVVVYAVVTYSLL